MSKFQKSTIFKSAIFWVITIAFITALLIVFVSPYLFSSFEDLTFRLFIASIVFFIPTFFVMLYSLFIRDETKEKIRAKLDSYKKHKKYSDIVQDKIQDLKTHFNEATRIVKNSSIYKNKKTAGYELPWYLLVGAQTEGKTCMLENSGLDFPLNINYDNRSVKEGGETKSFQWYFAEHAIFIDIPGNFISTNDSEENSIIWSTFLKLLGKKRWKRPINGVILTVSVDTLLEKNTKELETYIKDLRERFDELSSAFMSNIPIYLLVTKTDKISGFNEYFSNISEEEKDEVLGITFDDDEESIDKSIIQPKLEELLERLNSNVIDKINKEWDSDAKSKILLFCSEFSQLFEKLNTFVDIGFAKTRYRKPLMLRGIYFTSISAENADAMARQEFEESSLSSMEPQKSMFIKKLLSDIIFPEADIVKMDTNYKKNQRVKNIIAILVSVLIVSVATIYWVHDFNLRSNLLSKTERDMMQYENIRQNISPKSGFRDILTTLNKIENIENYNKEQKETHIWEIASFKVEKRNEVLQKLYKEALDDVLLPRIAKFMETQIYANIGNYDLTWESTKAYSMLHNEEKRDNVFLKGWMATAWSHLYPNMNSVQNDLNKHFAHLLEYGFKPYTLDVETMKVARQQLLEFGSEALVYKELKDEAQKNNLPDFRFSTALGSYASAFQGSDYTIPGFYTKKGFENIIIKDGKELIKKLVANNWVVGYSTKLSDSELNEMYAKVQNYYFIDYKNYWVHALSALDIPRYRSISELNNQLTVLTSGTSPIIGVLLALKENTMIYTPAEELQMKVKNSKAASIASQNAIEKAEKITNNTSVKNIREYFDKYNRLIDKNGRPTAKLATAMLKLNNVYQEMTSIYGSVTPAKDAYEIVINRISGHHEPIVMHISALPRPIDRWFKNALKNDWEYLLIQTKKYINSQYKQNVLGFYNDKIRGRYPLVVRSRKNDIRTQNFEEFFKKEGVLDSFYKNYIATFVNLNIRNTTFKYRSIDGSTVYINQYFMKQLLKAESIRKMFFTNKGDLLGTSLYFKPYGLGRNLSRMELHYDGKYIIYEHGPIKTTKLIWPAESPDSMAAFSISNLSMKKVGDISMNGEWAIFKLLDKFKVKGHKKRQGTDSILVEYKKQRYNGSLTITGRATKMYTKDNPLKSFKLKGNL